MSWLRGVRVRWERETARAEVPSPLQTGKGAAHARALSRLQSGWHRNEWGWHRNECRAWLSLGRRQPAELGAFEQPKGAIADMGGEMVSGWYAVSVVLHMVVAPCVW